jgi:hypothetical protein
LERVRRQTLSRVEKSLVLRALNSHSLDGLIYERRQNALNFFDAPIQNKPVGAAKNVRTRFVKVHAGDSAMGLILVKV